MNDAPADGGEARGVDVSVVILSYNRVTLLERTLAGVLAQRLSPGRTFDVVVVDNHPDRLAEELTTRLAAASTTPLLYLADPRRNISIVRN